MGLGRVVVAGAGRQGTAAALDLALRGGPEVEEILLADGDADRARRAAERVNEAAGDSVAFWDEGDASEAPVLDRWLEGADACLSALPYRFNPGVAEACLRASCHHADLGGDPETVAAVLDWDAPARERGVSLVPDCGLAPGLANVMTARALDLARETRGGDPAGGWHVEVRCGGLPREPRGPLGYALVFSPWGLLKEYDGRARVVRAGEITTVEALSGLEEIEFEDPPGCCEAFHTVGGASRMPESFAGRLAGFDYKTVRYTGHRDAVRRLRQLGLFSETPVAPADGTAPVSPRALLVSLLEAHLPREVPDLVVLRVTVRHPERPDRVVLELREFGDEELGLSAMERCTGYPAAAVVHQQICGKVPPGARPPELAVGAAEYLEGLRERGIEVRP